MTISQNYKYNIIAVFITIIASLISALALHVFVYPAKFVPLGVEAIVTLLYTIFPSISSGYFNLILNAPLIIFAFFKLDKKYVVFTMFFTLLSSLFLLVFSAVNLPSYTAEDGRIISAIFAGVMLGLRTGFMLKIGSSTGGVDIIACFIQKNKPYVNVERIISIICIVIIGVSYFVFNDFNCILLAVIQLFISEKTTEFVLRENREAIEIKIVTESPNELYHEVVEVMGHTATIVSTKGMYTDVSNFMVLTVVNRRQIPEIIKISKKYPKTFIYYSEVNGVYGKFRKNKDDVID